MDKLAARLKTAVDRSQAPRALPIVSLILAVIIVALTAYEGQRRGMDYIFALGPEGEQTSITVAISDMVYGLNAGYVGFASVRERLVSIWPKGADRPRNQIRLENEKIKGLQNSAIQAAASMPQPKPGYLGDRSLITVGLNEDIGYVDFVKLSFRLFGMNMEAMHYMFFLVLSISAAAFLLTFRSDTVAQAVLLCTLFSFYIEIYTGYFNYTTTFSGMRHGSTFSLMPMWHFIFLMFRRQRATIVVVACTLVQLVIFALALRMRGSAVWSVLFIVSFAALLAIIPFWRQRFWAWPWQSVVRRMACWPVVLLLSGLFVNSMAMNAALHAVYLTDDVLPYHGLWHSAVLGMRYSPEVLPPRSAELVRSGGSLDAAGYYAAEDYLKRTHFLQPPADPNEVIATYLSPWTGTIKWRFHDNIQRRVFFDILARHPVKMVVLYVYKKPLAIVRETIALLAQGESIMCAVLIVLGGAVVACILLLFRGAETDSIRSIPLMAGTAVLFAALPNIWAYSEFWAMSDFFLALLIFLQISVAILAVLATRQIRLWRHPALATTGRGAR
ncbi:MAG: hypothetical protein QOJ15_997 [Bradyrhizobium sp.]|jgi:hypothetical protein|nr:hypothetical protein [Bradyrhizobium sp.]